MKLNPADIALIVPSSKAADAAASGCELDIEFEDDADTDSDADEEGEAADDEGGDEGEGGSTDEDVDGEQPDLEAEAGDCEPGVESESDKGDVPNPEDVFGSDMSFECPEMTLEQNDAIADAIGAGMTPTVLSPHASLDVRPYCPHPDARALDSVVDYEFDSYAAQTRIGEIRGRVGTTSRIIAGQLRRVLASRAVAKTERDRRTGTLDRRKLHTLNRPGRQPNTRVFQLTVPGIETNTAIGVLVDQSGSMGWNGKMTCAQEATVALCDALQGLVMLGVKFGVWGFDSVASKNQARVIPGVDRTEPLRFHHYKGFDERWDRVSARVSHMSSKEDNCDGESVRWAGHQLLNVKAERRILIVLSDGCPAALTQSDPDRIEADLKLSVQQLETRGVEVLGIGIMDDSVSRFYPNNTVINSAKALEGTLMGSLRKMLLGTKAAA